MLLASALPFPVDAAGPVAPTIYGPTNIPAARNWAYSGQLVVDGPDAGVPLFGQTIGLYRNGVRVAEAETDAQGKYLVRASFPVGTHAVQARAFEGSPMESGSDVLSVRSYPTWPAGPALIRGAPGFYYTEANVSWLYPSTDGGYPVTSYRIDRSADGGPFSTVFTGNALHFIDTDVTPGSTYIYHGYATTAWGTSNKTSGVYTANDTVALVELVSYTLCDDVVCATVPDGGSFATNASRNVTVRVNLAGTVDTYPVAPPGLAGVTVHARVALPSVAKSAEAVSGAGGAWSGTIGTLYAIAPATSGCAAIAATAHAHPDEQGRSEDVGGFQLCV